MQGKRAAFLTGTAITLAFAALPASVAAQSTDGATPAPAPQDQADPENVIIVEGQVGAILESIDVKRDADSVIDVLSADQAGRFPDPNVAEALARIPGVGFQRENDTGDGEFISIRGLDAAYNTVLYDGLRTGTADEFRRTALDIVTSNGVSLIEVIKAPLPEHYSEGLGGIVNIRTRGALERREGGFLSAEITDNTFVDDYGFRFAGGYTHQLTDNFAVNVNAAFRRTYLDTLYVNPASFTLEQLNAITINGTTFTEEDPLELVPEGFLDPNDFTNEQINFEDNLIERDNYSLSGSLQWQASSSTIFTLGGRYTRDDTTQTTSNVEFDADNGDIDPDGMGGFLPSDFPDPEVTFEGQIEDSVEIRERYFFNGVTEAGNWTFDYTLGYSRAYEDEPVLSIDFTNDFDDVPGGRNDNAVTFVPLDFSNPPFAAPLPRDLDVFLLGIDPFCENPAESSGRCGEINDFDEALEDSRENQRYSARLDTTYEFTNGGVLDYIKFGGLIEQSDFETRFVDISDVDDSLGPNGEFLGVDDSDAFGGSLPDNNAVIGDYGLVDGSLSTYDRIGNPFADIGLNGVVLFDPTALRNLRRTFRDTFFASGADFEEVTFVTADERFYAGYAQAKLQFGRLNIVGGARIEQYDGEFSAPQTFDARISFDLGSGNDSVELSAPSLEQNVTETDNFEVLPRVAFNYELSDDMLLRFSYTTAIARPTFDLLAAEVDGDFRIELADGVNPNSATAADITDVEIDFDLGNPNLRNAYSQALDLSFEWYASRGNVFSVAAFYKTIDDFIFNSFAIEGAITPGGGQFDPASAVRDAPFSAEGEALLAQLGGLEAILARPGAQVNIRQPANGNRAEVYGIELGVFHQMDYLPGLLSNLSFSGNLTLQESAIDLDLGRVEAGDAVVVAGIASAGDTFTQEFDLFNSPSVTGNAALYYTDDSFEATIAYRYQGIQLEEIGTFGLSQYQQGRGFLDVDVEYSLEGLLGLRRASIYASVNDLLDGGRRPTTYETRGRGEQFPDFASFNGRTFRAGVRISF
ncbi:TonB-dependent receptor [Aurantiacibacter sp. MUD61]|uniref:TonB-dependent receptor n=1 Tax=Aurantiacibacter sp. MUD61 TaxID=3009083 RepID=UPI0022F07414|nr:TonB-dependent receptor [Aurantiacibacter sp. MUD61]